MNKIPFNRSDIQGNELEYLKPELSSSKDKSSKVADLEYGLN